ncbi:MAG TPA: BREX-2 system adenine-specific DNA-methyltransferase PglX [Micrococcales bacterium]|uniref:BREX-2 system adenine-specific DNA-methyltransferase PglX n=1 Tax=Miniimonas arenae TaxID=676201 RepID=UPI000EBE31B0|nr:BREX-2 system adenine-specific DNA-methyltransferase PglX [Miniimonas arenae]HCX84435.1 BREX-2 system adenine-specific DNA-methyltransferase PglX [Micrococcales bacterium]
MIRSATLLTDLKAQLKTLVADLRSRAETLDDPENTWGPRLREQFDEATRRERTGRSWIDWRDDQVDQAAVAWLVATTFLRFCEDNHLLDGARLDGETVATRWLAGPDGGTALAVENQARYLRANPTHNRRDWLLHAFEVLRAQPAARALVNDHNPVWTAWPSAEAATRLVDFWRETDGDGALVHDFTDPDLGTRFLGDLYQDLSDHAKKTYALLQTPVFVEEFILDRTLTPALAEFGLTGTDGAGFKLIDPTCGSGHFLLGAFERLHKRWLAEAPELGARERVRRAMDAIHGVDLNPFAVAIARFRLTVAGLKAAGETTLVGAAPLGFHLAVGDSLRGAQGRQDELTYDDEEPFAYDVEDLAEYQGILATGQYHVVVGNPPYITVKDKALNQAYREAYSTCKGKYALSVPFMELFFRLAIAGSAGRPAGFVGQITSNSFMKREFGKKLIEELLAGQDYSNPVDLLDVIDTSGAYIPGHGTPTVILVGRRRRPQADAVRAVLGVRGEPGQPGDPATGLVWSEIVEHVDDDAFDGTYVTVTNLERSVLATHPWSLSGGGAGALKELIDSSRVEVLSDVSTDLGVMAVLGEEEAFILPTWTTEPRRDLVIGEAIRDFSLTGSARFWPYDDEIAVTETARSSRWMWRFRRLVAGYLMFGQTRADRGMEWFEYGLLARPKLRTPLSITFAFVATHNHFVLDRGGKVFNRSAPVIKLPEGASEQDHLDLLGVLNSSTACFWLKHVSHNKGEGGGARVDAGYAAMGSEAWKDTYEFTGTKLQEFPLPEVLPGARGARLDALAQRLAAASPATVLGEPTAEVRSAVEHARLEWHAARAAMIAEQEELDWEVYRLYGLLEEDLTAPDGPPPLALGERAFEIALARKVAEGSEETAWSERHGSTPLTEIPVHWPAAYRDLVQRRLDVIASNPQIALLERPEDKRRWATPGWDALLRSALEDAILDRLEDPALWRDAGGPAIRTVAQLAVALRADEVLRELASLYTGEAEPDLQAVLVSLAPDEAVPYLAAHRYKESGVAKYRAWQATWDLQRREDAGERVEVPVPPKYAQADFRKATYWKARGKLDVPKERFIAYPEVTRTGERTLALGWAGWDHADQARVLLREIVPLLSDPDAVDRLVPMLAGLVELEPWLQQWHSEPEPGGQPSPASQVTGALTGLLAQLGLTRQDVTAWLPPAATRGRRPKGVTP